MAQSSTFFAVAGMGTETGMRPTLYIDPKSPPPKRYVAAAGRALFFWLEKRSDSFVAVGWVFHEGAKDQRKVCCPPLARRGSISEMSSTQCVSRW